MTQSRGLEFRAIGELQEWKAIVLERSNWKPEFFFTMVGANVKAETVTMMDKRQSIEAEMDGIISRLCVPNGPGLQGNLVDSEGFPRSDLDITAVRSDRQRLSVLRNDYKEITAAIEKNLITLHSGGFSKESTVSERHTERQEARPVSRVGAMDISSEIGHHTNSEGPSPMDEDAGEATLPIAVFDEVTEGSPAAMDGVLVGDQLLKFGSVDGGDNLLMRLAREGQDNEGRGLHVVVLRRGESVHLTVTPRRWSGRGLLGCHIQPL